MTQQHNKQTLITRALSLTEALIPTLDPYGIMGPLNHDDTIDTLIDMANNGVLIVHEQGLIGGTIGTSPINRSRTFAFERVFYAKAGFRSLIDEFEAWAVSQGAGGVVLSCFAPKVGRIYEKMGYSRLETYYCKGV